MTIKSVAVTIDRKHYQIAPGFIQGNALQQLGGISGNEQLLFEIDHEVDVPVGANDYLVIRGGEEFSIGDGSPPIEDNPCLRHPLRIHLNDNMVPESSALRHAKALGLEIKALDPSIKPSDGLFVDIKHLADEPVRDDQRIIIQKHDAFITTPCGNVGEGGVVFDHLDELRKVYPGAGIREDAAVRYLVIPDVVIPDIWNVSAISLLLLVPNGYPAAAMDMFWVSSDLRLKDGREPQGGNTYEQHLGQRWQRFSWHYGEQQTAWQPGRSSFLTHLRFALSRLANAI